LEDLEMLIPLGKNVVKKFEWDVIGFVSSGN
jgi:hypothetical protein